MVNADYHQGNAYRVKLPDNLRLQEEAATCLSHINTSLSHVSVYHIPLSLLSLTQVLFL